MQLTRKWHGSKLPSPSRAVKIIRGYEARRPARRAGPRGHGLTGRFQKAIPALPKQRLKLPGAWSWDAASDRHAVNPGDRHDLHACIGQKTLACPGEVGHRIATFLRIEAGFSRKAQHHCARNPIEDAAFKRRGASTRRGSSPTDVGMPQRSHQHAPYRCLASRHRRASGQR